MSKLELQLRRAGIIKHEEFVTAAGMPANTKVEWSVVDNDPKLTALAAGRLAVRFEAYSPQLIIAVPRGGRVLAKATADMLGIDYFSLEWLDKEKGELDFPDERSQEMLMAVESLALVDDVFTTGRNLRFAARVSGVNDKIVVGGVGWDRSDSGSPKNLTHPLEAAVRRYVPLRSGK